MSTSSDATNYYYVTDNGDGAIMTRADEPWAFNGGTPTATAATTASGYAAVVATDASGGATHAWGFDSSAHMQAFIYSVGSMQAALIAKGIIS